MKNILVLTDLSNRAEYAAEYALNIAIKSKSNLLLCHVLELSTNTTAGLELNFPLEDQLGLESKRIPELKALTKRLEKLVPEVDATEFTPSINYIIAFGPIVQFAEKIIEEKLVRLVVIGAHKSNGLSRFIFGSHTHAILDKINCPVLLVPENLKFKSLKTIAYASDLTFNNQKVIQYLMDIANPFDALIAVTHISLPGFPATASEQAMGYSLNDQLGPDHPTMFYHTIKGNDVKASLMEITNSGKADILALVHKRYGFFERLFHASISKQMADDAKVPLLILPYSFSVDVAEITNDQLDQYCFEPGDFR